MLATFKFFTEFNKPMGYDSKDFFCLCFLFVFYLCVILPGRGVSEKVSAVSFCLGSGLFGSCNSD